MSAIENPNFGIYGTWEAENPECVARGLDVNHETRMIILLFASICFCQVLFMASRAPRVTWEAVYLPLVETILYGMAASGNGQMRLSDGRVVPIARFCSWLITCPIMLFQVVNIHHVTWYGVPVRNMVMAASLIRTVFGIGASVSEVQTTRWVQYGLACMFFLFELAAVYQIFGAGLRKFSQVKTRVNDIVYARIILLRAIFYFSWNSFPIIWLLSNTGLCLISENATVLAYLVADLVCKNVYGIINTNTLFQVMNGAWVAETGKEGGHVTRDIGETYLEMMIAGMRGQRREESESGDDAASELAETLHQAQASHIVDIDQQASSRAYTRHLSKEQTQYYAESMKPRNKNPESFIDEADLPRIDLSAQRHHLRSSSAEPRHSGSPQDVCVLVADGAAREGAVPRIKMPPPERLLSPREEVEGAGTGTVQWRPAIQESCSDLRPDRLSREELLELVRRLGTHQAQQLASGHLSSPRSSHRQSFRARDRGEGADRLHSAELLQRRARSPSRELRGRSREASPDVHDDPSPLGGSVMGAA